MQTLGPKHLTKFGLHTHHPTPTHKLEFGIGIGSRKSESSSRGADVVVLFSVRSSQPKERQIVYIACGLAQPSLFLFELLCLHLKKEKFKLNTLVTRFITIVLLCTQGCLLFSRAIIIIVSIACFPMSCIKCVILQCNIL